MCPWLVSPGSNSKGFVLFLRVLQALFLTIDLISDVCITREEKIVHKMQNASYIVSFVVSLFSFTLRHNQTMFQTESCEC
jgi:hypothetical protein